MSTLDRLDIAFVHDWLTSFGGAERVLEAALECFPDAVVHTLVHDPRLFEHSAIGRAEVRTSFLQRMPFARRAYRHYLPLMPFAVEQFDLRPYHIVLSFSSAVAHGVLVRPDQLHVNYIYTPARFAWHQYHDYLGWLKGAPVLKRLAVRPILHYLRLWDHSAAGRVDHFIAISEWIAGCVWRAYRRRAEVIHPPVNLQRFRPAGTRADYYITMSRLVPQKRIDLIVETFTDLGLPLKIVGEGPERRRLAQLAGPNVELVGWLADDELAALLSRAKAYVHGAEEDFGIAPLEAYAAGVPVIALRRGGLPETLRGSEGALFYEHPTPASLATAICRFEAGAVEVDPIALRDHARSFGKERFQQELVAALERAWTGFGDRTGEIHLRRDEFSERIGVKA